MLDESLSHSLNRETHKKKCVEGLPDVPSNYIPIMRYNAFVSVCFQVVKAFKKARR